MKTQLFRWVCAALVLVCVPALHAQNTLDFTGTTVSAPTTTLPGFGSTVDDCGPAVTGAEPFVRHSFTVDTDATYDFTIVDPISTIASTDDTVLTLYTVSLGSSSTCTGFVALGNETPGSGLSIDLTNGTAYTLIVSGFLGTEDDYQVQLTGPETSTITELGALPVTLTSFRSVVDGDAVTLHWNTESAVNHAGFEIQMQADTATEADTWQTLGFVEGVANTDERQAYQYHTEALAPGAHRFRLKSVDLDGTFTYSDALEVAIGVPGTHELSEAFPNPFNQTTTFTLALAEAQQVRVEAFDMLGRRVGLVLDGPLSANQVHRVTFGADTALSSGMYVLHITGETFASTQMVSLVR